MRYKCNLCGRDKFNKPTPHYCRGIYIKYFKRHAKKIGFTGEVWELLDNADN